MVENNLILLVEDDEGLGFVTKDALENQGFKILWVRDGEEALTQFHQQPFDLLILDVMLPKMDGFKVAQNIRTVNSTVPILFLSAKSMLEDRLEGFQTGGDDYITKPFSIDELIYKINVFLKRSAQSKSIELNLVISIGKYLFKTEELLLIYQEKTKFLTKKEARLLAFFGRNQGKMLSREQILEEVWGKNDYFLGRSLDVFIVKLRKYLKEDSRINIINYHGVGFKLEVEE